MASAAAVQAAEQLKASFPGRVTTPDAESYGAARDGPWSQTCWIPAAAYVVLNNASEVASALAIIKKAGCKFAIRTSGHNPNVGFSSVDGSGVVLDLSGLDEKSLGSDDSVLHAGPGNRWGPVYTFLQEQGLSPVGGREVQVGLGGFLTGGGYPAFASLYGTGPDGVKGCEVVLADGTIVEANANTHADLWRALKGGTSNFGIVTRFDIETHPETKARYTIQLYNPADYVNINAAILAVQEEMEKDPKVNIFTNFNQGFVAVFHMYADCLPAAEQPKAFGSFDKLSSKINTPLPQTDGNVLSFVQVLSQMGHVPHSLKRKIGTLTTRLGSDLYNEVHELYQEVIKKVPQGAMLHYTIQPLSTLAVQAGEDRGGNMMGLEKVPQCWWVFTAEWPQELPDGSAVEQAHTELLQGVEEIARGKGLLLDFLCPSFAGADQSQRLVRGFGEENLKQMQEVSAKYDPEGVFQKLQSDGFLLRHA
ncbi:hypothetical protein VMCG_06301 [Cytospora schulzeri]|uniref:FAD-binding PCMH-type domain-containing protein n=1 Tax=Cytospora schulzeri TaxID=448051 RepID=A0A423W837_9PEZI|nr:hypothetical protein VMCG_06301 [Valsa malicola]